MCISNFIYEGAMFFIKCWIFSMFVFSEFYAMLKVDLHAGNVELIRLLLSKGALVDSQSDSGTPLIWAAGHGQTDAVEVLLEHHANVSM